jgi:hypothetical protein
MIEKPIKADILVRSLGGNLRDAVLNPFHIHSMSLRNVAINLSALAVTFAL